MPQKNSKAIRKTATCIAAACVAGLALTAPVAASDVAQTQGGTVRLIRGPIIDGVAHLGLEIAMQPGWHTYWRYPGDSGVPPEITLAQGNGDARLTVAYPAPERFGTPGDETIGYDGDVVLPLSVTLGTGPAPATVAVTARLGICHDICLPVDETLSVPVDAARPPAPVDVARLRAAEANVPKPVTSDMPFSVTAVDVDETSKPAVAQITLKSDDATVRDVFVEGPVGWALPLPKRTTSEPGTSRWRFALDGLPSDATWQGARLTITVVAAEGAATQTVSLK